MSHVISTLAQANGVLQPAGDQASRIAGMWWFFFAVLAGVFTLVIAALVTAVALRRSGRLNDVPNAVLPQGKDRGLRTGVVSAVVATVVLVFILLGSDILSSPALFASAPPDSLPITLVSHRWWWDARYTEGPPSEWVSTANEIHIPVGRPVRLDLSSRDVIHSFWVPPLHGKKDMIPGHDTSTWFVARSPGRYVGRCAEFCGLQHAHMQLTVVAEPPEQFAAWLAAQKKVPPPPANDPQRRGQEIFLQTTCVMCHAIQGTTAKATVGPELTHFASRPDIGAGALPNTRDALAKWIRDPAQFKPGVLMPAHNFRPDELEPLLDYLATLQ
jgi:cytochrome c oxidase subunit II